MLRYAEFADGNILWTPPDRREEVAVINTHVAEVAQHALRAAAHSYGMPLLYAKTGTTDNWRIIAAYSDQLTGIFAETKKIFSSNPHEQGDDKNVPIFRRLANKMLLY